MEHKGMPKRKIKPRFEVHKLPGTSLRRIATPNIKVDGKGKPILDKNDQSILLGGFTYHDEEVDAGWMVYFPHGSSVHVWTEAEMKRQNFLGKADLVDMDSGEVIDEPESMSLKDLSEMKERTSKPVHHTT
jgi:hypothetical protein|tara:strand:+ start:25 stop:417 length:393 start_codon:yes stop_codon:yes gene_type:complete